MKNGTARIGAPIVAPSAIASAAMPIRAATRPNDAIDCMRSLYPGADGENLPGLPLRGPRYKGCMALPAAILDVDGTLVDTNYHHAIAWYRAFRRHEIVLPLWRIHRHMGMGGDQLVGSLCGTDVEERLGDDIRAAEKDLYMGLIDEIAPLPDARRLIEVLKERGHAVVLASSAKSHEVDHYLDLLDARELVDG